MVFTHSSRVCVSMGGVSGIQFVSDSHQPGSRQSIKINEINANQTN